MTMDKFYHQKYYQDHKKELNERNKKYYKENLEKKRVYAKNYRDKFLKKNKSTTNKSGYLIISMENSYLHRYGKTLSKTKDDITGATHKIRVFCMDCINYKGSKFLDCPGWENCPYREEVAELINKKGGETSGKTT